MSFVLTLIGIFFLQCGKYTNCTGTFLDELDDQFGAWLVFLGWYVTGIVVIAMFVISGVLVPLAVIFSDVCIVAADFPTDMHAYLDKIIVAPGASTECPPTGCTRRRLTLLDEVVGVNGELWRGGGGAGGRGGRSLLSGQSQVGPVDVFIGCYNKKKLLETLNMSR